MLWQTVFSRTLWGVLPALALGACSGGGGANVPQAAGGLVSSSTQRAVLESRAVQRPGANARPNWISLEAQIEAQTTGLLFVADATNNDVAIFSKKNPTKPIGMITDQISYPEEIAVDASANVYVTNLSNNNVTVYAAPYTAPPSMIYSTGMTYPFSVTVGTKGRVYVSNNPGNSTGQVNEYPANVNQPSLTLAIRGYAEGVALDGKNQLYVGLNPNGGNARVLKFAPGAKSGVNLGLPLQFVSGLVLDKGGNLLVEDQIPAVVDVFAPGMKKPSQVIDNGGAGFGDPVSIALGTDEHLLYVGDGKKNLVYIVAYPSGKTLQTLGGFGRVHGVAVSPPAPK